MITATFVNDSDAPAGTSDFLLQRFPKWTLAHWCVVVFAFSFLTLAILPEGRLNDFEVPLGAESVRVARSLAVRGAFADPFAVMPTGPTAHLAPIYPFFYSIILRLFGTGYTALGVAWACNVACFALQMALLPLLSYRLNLGILAGLIGAALGTISLHAPMDTRWEHFFAGTLLLLVCLVTRKAFHDQNLGTVFAAGGLWGMVVLTNPVLVLLLIAWPPYFVFSRAVATPLQALRRVGVIVAVALLVVSPWIVRNYLRFGTFIFVRDNLGLELYTGNNDCAAPDLEANIASGCHARTHPNPSLTIAAQLVAVGEVSFYRADLRKALHWMSTHPGAFFQLTTQRFLLFWFPRTERGWEGILAGVVTLLSFPGVILVARRNPCAAGLIVTAWILFPLVYYIVPFEPRYRYPIFWTSLLPAGYAPAVVLNLQSDAWWRPREKRFMRAE